MKNLRTYVLCTSMIFASIFAAGQTQKIPVNEPDYNKPHLFDNLPAKISFDPATFTGQFNKPTGSTISTSLSKDAMIPFEGKIESQVVEENGRIEKLSIQSTNYPGATFNLTRITSDDGTIRYIGRLISFSHGDLFILQQINGRYELVKKNFYDLVNE
jgi:hypothetical protein